MHTVLCPCTSDGGVVNAAMQGLHNADFPTSRADAAAAGQLSLLTRLRNEVPSE